MSLSGGHNYLFFDSEVCFVDLLQYSIAFSLPCSPGRLEILLNDRFFFVTAIKPLPCY